MASMKAESAVVVDLYVWYEGHVFNIMVSDGKSQVRN